MSLGTAVLVLGVLCLLVFSAGFRRFALWASTVAIAALICGFFYWRHVEHAQEQAEFQARFQKECVEGNRGVDWFESAPDPDYRGPRWRYPGEPDYPRCVEGWMKAHAGEKPPF
jgi:hypothetical protein